MSQKDITLYGAGGHCFAAADLILSLGDYIPIEILDDDPKVKSILDIPVKKFQKSNTISENVCITIGNNSIRKEISKILSARFPSFIHKSVIKYPSVIIGYGTLIHPNVVLDSSVKIADFCIINNSASIAHNTEVGNFVHVAIQVGIAGGVSIGEGTLVGAGSVILPEINVGKWAVVGAGSVVTKDVPDYAVVYGNPARIIKYTNEK